MRLKRPDGDERVPAGTRDYLRARAQRHAYNLVMAELNKAGISRATLARRMGKGADRVSKMLGGPANWTIVTLADLLFAINGGVPSYGVDYPLERVARNLGPRDRFYIEAQGAKSTTSQTPVQLSF
jgi:hypothetical protein